MQECQKNISQVKRWAMSVKILSVLEHITSNHKVYNLPFRTMNSISPFYTLYHCLVLGISLWDCLSSLNKLVNLSTLCFIFSTSPASIFLTEVPHGFDMNLLLGTECGQYGCRDNSQQVEPRGFSAPIPQRFLGPVWHCPLDTG